MVFEQQALAPGPGTLAKPPLDGYEFLKSLDRRQRPSVFLLTMGRKPREGFQVQRGEFSPLVKPGNGDEMKAENGPIRDPAGQRPVDVLQKFVDVFAGKGWLNQGLRILYQERRYRVFCSEEEFIAQRINDNCGVSWGFPCWTVCMVTLDQIIEDSRMSGFPSMEPGVHDWLRCLAGGDFKIL